jgi:hypothetical protein
MGGEIVRQVIGLAVVFGLLGLVVWQSRKRQGGGIRSWLPSREAGGRLVLRQVAHLRLSPGHSLHFVEADGHRMLLGCSPSGMTILPAVESGGKPAGAVRS